MKKLRNYFITGILVLLPVILTFYVLWLAYIFVAGIIERYVGGLLEALTGVGIPGLGVVVSVLGIMLVGILAHNVIGKRLLSLWDALVERIPLVRIVYMTIKQIVTGFTGHDEQSFQRVVLLEYPHKDSYAIGFITGTARGAIESSLEDEALTVFVPTTPNPTSGFLLIVPRREVKVLDMSIEEGIRLVISGGIAGTYE